MLLVAGFGACGAVGRYLVGLLVLRVSGGASLMFLATMIVNALGSFLFGYLASLGPHVSLLTPALRLGLLTGFMGAFTTFSAFSMDTLLLLQQRGPSWAAGYLLAQNILGIALAFFGVQLGRSL